MEGAKLLKKIIKNRELDEVCGVNYVLDYHKWIKRFLTLIN